MFHFPSFASSALCIQAGMTGHDSRRVSPFRNPRIIGCLAPPRGLSQPTASFIAFQRPGIRPLPLITYSQILSFQPYSIVKEHAENLFPLQAIARIYTANHLAAQTGHAPSLHFPSARTQSGGGERD